MTDDQREPLRVFTPSGVPTNVVKTRGDIHRDGDWHLAAFCWVFDRGTKRVLVQRRSFDKDVWAGRWDASAAGHVAAHEDARAAMTREIHEELGLRPELVLTRLRPVEIGPLHAEEHIHPGGLIDRELHAVHVLGVDAERERFAPGPEVTALGWIALEDLPAFAYDAPDTIDVTLVDGGTLTLSPNDRVPYAPAYLRALVSWIRRSEGGPPP